ncbi:MAG: DUF4395 domain-containing protein [Sporichthyaceae bacterium]
MPSSALPSLVDPRGPRVGAALTTLVLAVALATGWSWLLVAQAAVFALGVAGRSPYGVAYGRLVRPRLAPPAELEDARPLRFAQTVGLLFTLVALAGLALPTAGVTLVATAAALAAAFLNAAFGVCLGCEAYLLLRRSNPIARTVPNPRAATAIRSEVHA